MTAATNVKLSDFLTEEEIATLKRLRHARRAMARVDGAAFNEFVLRDEETAEPISNAPVHLLMHRTIDRNRKCVLWAHIEVGKAVPLSTEIPTPTGWRTMGELQVGDEVFGRDGRRCRVTFVTPPMVDHEVFRIRFNDGDEVLADAEHQWVARTADETSRGDGWRTVTTRQMLEDVAAGWGVPLAGAAMYPARDLAVAPYEMGQRLAAGEGDRIPPEYLTASVEQREALFLGLTGLRSSFYGGEPLARDVLELMRSLGYRAKIREETGGWRAFTLADRVTNFDDELLTRREIVAIEPVPSVPVKCISVDSTDHTYLLGRSYTVTHNTSAVSIGRVLFELARNPNLRVLIVSATVGFAKKIVGSIAQYIEHSQELHELFPNLVKGKLWTQTELTVERNGTLKDPSVRAVGVGTKGVTGARCDLLILDDVLSQDNTRTPEQRDAIWKWLRRTLLSRLTAQARVICVGTAWTQGDIYHRLVKQKWASRKFPVVGPDGLPTWPERWSLARIKAKEEELGPVEAQRQLYCNPQDESAGQVKEEWIQACLRAGDGYEFVERLDPRQLPVGAVVATGVDLGFTKKHNGALSVIFTILIYPDRTRQILSIKSGRFSGPEVLDIAYDHHRRYGSIIYVETNGAQKLLLDFADEWLNNERKKAQETGEVEPLDVPPIMPFQTGSNKNHPVYGIAGLLLELRGARWLFPNDGGALHPEMELLIAALRAYDPTPGVHTADHAMAMWISREGGRKHAGELLSDKPTVVKAMVFGGAATTTATATATSNEPGGA